MKKEVWLAALSAMLAGCSFERKSLTQEQQLDRLLSDLAEKPAPKIASIGASCYMPMETPDRIEYVCPTCGEKTIFSSSQESEWSAAWDVESHRYGVIRVKELGLDAALDERSLCAVCRTKMTPPSKVGDVFLEVKIGEKITRTKLQPADFSRLVAFLRKEETWNLGMSLKDELPRIRTLLGME